MKEIQYRPLGPEEITRDLFRSFERRQVVDWCWRRERGQWVIRQDPFVDQWSEADYAFLVTCLQHTLSAGGVVFGAFCEGNLKGFASVEHNPLGSHGQYRDLTSLHVSQEPGERIGPPSIWAGSGLGQGPGGGEAVYIRPLRRRDPGILSGHGMPGGRGMQPRARVPGALRLSAGIRAIHVTGHRLTAISGVKRCPCRALGSCTGAAAGTRKSVRLA